MQQIPSVLYAIVLLIVALVAANLVQKLVTKLLKAVKAEEYLQYVLVIIFLVQGINVLNLPVLTGVGTVVIGYMPAILTAIIIFAIGIFAAKAAIYVMVAFLVLSQLSVANKIVETAFVLIVGAVCIAFAIAFGIGGRKFASDMLEKVEKKIEDKK